MYHSRLIPLFVLTMVMFSLLTVEGCARYGKVILEDEEGGSIGVEVDRGPGGRDPNYEGGHHRHKNDEHYKKEAEKQREWEKRQAEKAREQEKREAEWEREQAKREAERERERNK